jgi:hypothetical protein
VPLPLPLPLALAMPPPGAPVPPPQQPMAQHALPGQLEQLLAQQAAASHLHALGALHQHLRLQGLSPIAPPAAFAHDLLSSHSSGSGGAAHHAFVQYHAPGAAPGAAPAPYPAPRRPAASDLRPASSLDSLAAAAAAAAAEEEKLRHWESAAA